MHNVEFSLYIVLHHNVLDVWTWVTASAWSLKPCLTVLLRSWATEQWCWGSSSQLGQSESYGASQIPLAPHRTLNT